MAAAGCMRLQRAVLEWVECRDADADGSPYAAGSGTSFVTDWVATAGSGVGDGDGAGDGDGEEEGEGADSGVSMFRRSRSSRSSRFSAVTKLSMTGRWSWRSKSQQDGGQ